ncbi:RraA-like protein [Zopfia rhizophila CBS 207.26]|uniref:Cytochrome b-c1 complex subunit 6, mitochondrial n=1 Tax=Zopfia rhizophila CBS 207.26 TaxID=1314779 RepID=A0A6A6EUR6_9PEZI|nr:RraA-like protein [Zopfia rhizophila CBS 207.26]
MVPKASGSFPNPAQASSSLPESNLKDTTPYADYTERNSIVLISQPPEQKCAVVGGIMAARMKYLGAQGVVVDGRVRDLVGLGELGVPIWSRGTSIIGAGAESKFHARNVPVTIGDVVVEPGDIIMADPNENGVVAVPKGRVDELLELLPKLVGADEKVLKDVEEGGGASTSSPASGTDEESGEEAEVNKADAKDGEDGEEGYKPEGDDEEAEEEEEEEETVDPKDQLEEECKESRECAPAKHHYDECVERVTGQIENDGKAKEDCVEEFFHLAHCATQCAAPKLFAQLK